MKWFARRRTLLAPAIAACLIWVGSHTWAATISWNQPAGGTYELGANWTGGTAPTFSDNAVFDLAGQTYVVTVSSPRDLQQLRIGAGSVTLQLQTGLFGDFAPRSTAVPSFVIGLSPAAAADAPAALTFRGARAFTRSGVIGYGAGSKGQLTIDGSASNTGEMIMDGTLDVGAAGSGKLLIVNGGNISSIEGNVGTGATAGRVELSGRRSDGLNPALWSLATNLNVGALGEIAATDGGFFNVNEFASIAGSVSLSDGGLRVQKDLTISGSMMMEGASHLFLQGALKMSPGGLFTLNNNTVHPGNILAAVKSISDDGGQIVVQSGLLKVTDGITFGAGRAVGNNATLSHGAQLLTPANITIETGATLTMDAATDGTGPTVTASRLVIAAGGTFNFNLGRLEFTDPTFDVAIKSGGLLGSTMNLSRFRHQFAMAGNLSIGGTPGAGGAPGGSASIGSSNSITAATLTVGASSGDLGALTVAGDGNLTIRGNTVFGDAGKGELKNDGVAFIGFGSAVDGDFVLGKQSGGEGIYTTNDGFMRVDGTIIIGDAGNGTLTLNGVAAEIETARNGDLLEAYIGKTIGSQGTANINGGAWTHRGGLTVGQASGSGSGTLAIAGGTVDLQDDGGAGSVLTIQSTGVVTVNGGGLRTKRIDVAPGGSFTYTEGSLELLDSDLTVGGPLVSDSVNLIAGETLGVVGQTTINSGKNITLDGGRFYTNSLVNEPGGLVYNSGELTIGEGSAGVGSDGNLGAKLIISGESSNVGVQFLSITDSGAVDDPNVGVVAISDGGNLSTESLSVGPFAVVNLTDATLGAFRVDIAQGGTLSGRGSISTSDDEEDGGIFNDGLISPGNSIGTLEISGDVTLLDDSVLQIELDTEGNSDLLSVSGALTLDGALELTGGAPELTYLIATYDPERGLSGEFDSITPGFTLDTTSSPGQVLLTAVPEPTGALSVMLLAAMGAMRRGRGR